MSDYLTFLIWPFLAGVVLVGIHVYFGLHIIRRGIIFVDLSLAQVAALGMTSAFLFGFDPNSVLAYVFSLAFAVIGAGIFTLTRNMEGKIPQEAIIGIVYAVSSAAAILAVSHSPEGAEHIRYILIGSILTVTPAAVLKTAGVYLVVGLFHWLARSNFVALSFQRKPVAQAGLWEFLFYATFAVVVTSSVRIAGVLLVFILLVVPSVFATLQSDKIGTRLALGWIFGLIGVAVGLVLSFALDTPTGATVVVTFGLMLLAVVPYRLMAPIRKV